MVYRSPDCHCIGVYVHCTTEILAPHIFPCVARSNSVRLEPDYM